MLINKLKQAILFGILIITLTLFIDGVSNAAVSTNQFQAGRIIDDNIFNNSATMSTSDIQNFLNSKVPNCDSGVTCLKGYIENPNTHINNINNTGASISGGLSSAQIISDAATSYGINPEVLIVLLQKEEGLVMSSNPSSNQFQTATGYDCPDTSGCDAGYYGFYNQVMKAAWQFRQYALNPYNYNYIQGNGNCDANKGNVQNCIAYNPNSYCGSAPVSILSQATASLYNYTPYQPNSAAINNFGNGDSCSSWGNLNFWYLFNSWFGPSVSGYSSSDINWNSETLSGLNSTVHTESGTLGGFTSTVTIGGVLHVFYYNSTRHSLEHAWADLIGWHFENLDGVNSSYPGAVADDVGMYLKAKIINNSIYVMYYDNTSHSVRIAQLNSGGWQFNNLDGSSSENIGHLNDDVGKGITLTQYGDSVQTFYFDSTQGNLRHAWTDQNGWHFENLDGDTGSIGHLNDNLGQSPYADTYGTSLQLYYYDATQKGLRHAWTDQNGWHFENLDGFSGNSLSKNSNDVGLYPNFINYGGELQLYYYNNGQKDLRHAWNNQNGWHFENLDGDTGSVSGHCCSVGKNPVVIQYNNALRIYYYDEQYHALSEAYTNSTGWHFDTLDGTNTSVTRLSNMLGENFSIVPYGGGIQLFEQNISDGSLRHLWN